MMRRNVVALGLLCALVIALPTAVRASLVSPRLLTLLTNIGSEFTPVWAVAVDRSANRIYIAKQGFRVNGELVAIDGATDSVDFIVPVPGRPGRRG